MERPRRLRQKGRPFCDGGIATLLTSSANIAAANPWSAMIHVYQGTPLSNIDAVRWGTYVLYFFPNYVDDKTYLYTTDGAASYGASRIGTLLASMVSGSLTSWCRKPLGSSFTT